MGGEVIERALLAGQLAKRSGENRSDQCGLADAALTHDGDQPLTQSVEVNADFIWECLSDSPQPQVMQSHGVSSQGWSTLGWVYKNGVSRSVLV